jgi:hypothetical protein
VCARSRSLSLARPLSPEGAWFQTLSLYRRPLLRRAPHLRRLITTSEKPVSSLCFQSNLCPTPRRASSSCASRTPTPRAPRASPRKRCFATSSGWVGLAHFTRVILQSEHQLMTPSMVHITNLTPPGSDNLSRVCGHNNQLTTASMVHVTNLTPGSANPRRRFELGRGTGRGRPVWSVSPVRARGYLQAARAAAR